MTFEEEKEMAEDLFLHDMKDGDVLDVAYLRKNFIHKKKVKEAIDKIFPTDKEEDAHSIILNNQLKKELGLE